MVLHIIFEVTDKYLHIPFCRYASKVSMMTLFNAHQFFEEQVRFNDIEVRTFLTGLWIRHLDESKNIKSNITIFLLPFIFK